MFLNNFILYLIFLFFKNFDLFRLKKFKFDFLKFWNSKKFLNKHVFDIASFYVQFRILSLERLVKIIA